MRRFNPGRRPLGLAPGYYLRVPFGDVEFALAWLAEARGLRTEAGGRRTEDRRQRTENSGHWCIWIGQGVITLAEKKSYPAIESLR